MDTNSMEEQYEEISLLDLAVVFARGKKTIFCTTFIFAAIGLVYVLAFGPEKLYQSKLQAMLVAPYLIDKENVSIKTDNGIIEAIVRSESMKRALDSEFHFMNKLREKNKDAKWRDLDKNFEESLNIDIDGSTINIYVKAKEPKLAQDMATFIFKRTDKALKDMGIIAVDTVNRANDVMLEKEIKEKIADIDASENRRSSAKVTELLGMYSAIMARDEGYRLKEKQPMGLQLLSPASLPDSPEPRGRAKTVVLFTMLGFFLGLVAAFMKYVWSTANSEKKEAFITALKG